MSAKALGWLCAIFAGGVMAACEFLLDVPGFVQLFLFAQFGLGIVAGMCSEIDDQNKRRRRGRHGF